VEAGISVCLDGRKPGVVMPVAFAAGIRDNYLASLYRWSKHTIVGFAKAMGQCDPEAWIRVVCMCSDILKTLL